MEFRLFQGGLDTRHLLYMVCSQLSSGPGNSQYGTGTTGMAALDPNSSLFGCIKLCMDTSDTSTASLDTA